jgi:hypothetical protein
LQLFEVFAVMQDVALKKNHFIGLLCVTTLGSAVFAWHEHQRVASLQNQFDQATASLNADWQKRLALAQQRALDLENALASARHRADARQAELANGEGANGAFGRNRRDSEGRFGDFLALMDDPKFAKLMATEQRGQLDSRYAALFKNLKLSPEDLDKFKSLLVEKQNSMRDVMSAARAQGLNPQTDRTAFQQLVSQTNSEVDASIQATLGAAGFQQYQQYEQTLPERNLVSQLDQRLSYSNTPLNPDQQDQLMQVLAQAAPPSSNDNPARGGPNGPRFNVTDQAISQASSVLTPDQVAALQQIQQEQQAQRQIFQQMRQQQPPPPAATSTGSGTPTAVVPIGRPATPITSSPSG